jgi:hypothetical protein
MSAFQVAAAVATGVLTIEAAAIATGVLAIGAIGAIAVNHMQPTQYDISEEMLRFYDSDYEFYRYLREHEELFAYSVNNYGLTMGVNRVRANMQLEQWQQQNNSTREEIPQDPNIHQTTEECRFQGNFNASRFIASFEFSWTKSTVFK